MKFFNLEMSSELAKIGKQNNLDQVHYRPGTCYKVQYTIEQNLSGPCNPVLYMAESQSGCFRSSNR